MQKRTSGTYGGKVIQDNLVFQVDAANGKSYTSGDTTVTELTTTKLNGTLNNGVGYIDGAWSFDGVNDNISFGALNDLNGLEDVLTGATPHWTMGVWAYQNSPNTGGNLMSSFHPSFAARGILFDINGGTQLLVSTNWDGGDGGNSGKSEVTFVPSATFELQAETWYYLVATFNADNTPSSAVQLYINGTEYATAGGPLNSHPEILTAAGNQIYPIHIGSYGNGSLPFYGRIANASIYNRVLTNDEILQNYNTLKYRYI